MSKFFNNKLFRYLSVFLFLNSAILPVKSSSALAAWVLKTDGVLELKTKSNTNLKAYFQKANQLYGDRFWVDFPGELNDSSCNEWDSIMRSYPCILRNRDYEFLLYNGNNYGYEGIGYAVRKLNY